MEETNKKNEINFFAPHKFNHGGDETAGLLGDPHLTTDSVRWDVVAPEEAEDRATAGNWAMEVKATQDIPKGCALLLSYGERSGDDFFLHYGKTKHGCAS